MGSQDGETSAASRRSLFPTSYAKKSKKEEKNVSFSPYARCLRLEPQDLTEDDKSELWWQKDDYEDFARAGRIISKAMLEGGSEIWLRSEPSSVPKDRGPLSSKKTMDDTTIDTSSPTSTTPLHHDFITESESQEYNDMQGKWWHKFGHSRRGLEHITNISEGRERQSTSKSSIRSVLEEQKRQEMFLPKGYFDVDKFRSVYRQATHWARLLARAAAESDQDAVQTKFNEARRKTREHYLKKHFDTQSDCAITDADLPCFMTTSSPMRPTKRINLDANTMSQICFRRKQAVGSEKTKLSQVLLDKSQPQTDENETRRTENAEQFSTSLIEEKKSEDDDDNHTVTSTCTEDSSTSLAKIAAGWGKDESSSPLSPSKKHMCIDLSISSTPNITIG